MFVLRARKGTYPFSQMPAPEDNKQDEDHP
jgi:hypothetical protein